MHMSSLLHKSILQMASQSLLTSTEPSKMLHILRVQLHGASYSMHNHILDNALGSALCAHTQHVTYLKNEQRLN